MLDAELQPCLFGVHHYNPPVKRGKPFCVNGFEREEGVTSSLPVGGGHFGEFQVSPRGA